MDASKLNKFWEFHPCSEWGIETEIVFTDMTTDTFEFSPASGDYKGFEKRLFLFKATITYNDSPRAVAHSELVYDLVGDAQNQAIERAIDLIMPNG